MILKKCVICDCEIETHKHLFFNCEFSKQCIQRIKTWLGINASTTDFYVLLRWINKRAGKYQFRKNVVFTAVWAAIYMVWSVRNKALWEQKVATAYSIVSIQGMIKHRVKT